MKCIFKWKIQLKNQKKIAFLQHEISQMSDELYSQQKEVSVLKKKFLNFEKRINDLESGNENNMIIEHKKPPHY